MTKKFVLILMCVCLILGCCYVTAFADDTPKSEANTEEGISLKYEVDEGPVSDVEFSIYRVASLGESNRFQWTDAFKDCKLTLDVYESNASLALATALDAYISLNETPADGTATTDSLGGAVFSGLEDGLYLVVGKSSIKGDYKYAPIPVLIPLPYYDDADNAPQYNVDIEIKYVSTYIPRYITLNVEKVWEDNDSAQRPNSVYVQLLQDGEVVDTVELNAENSWSHTWTDLDARWDWKVFEIVPDGYTMTMEQEGTDLVITNTRVTPPVDPEDPTDPGNPTDPKNPGNPDDPGSPDKPSESIPKTGQLWWPVSILAGAGILCIVIGLIIKLRKRREADA